tara:strand:+ start:111 stop:338 length:228 start_codon:yes stop_codon:yes gene_type:complete
MVVLELQEPIVVVTTVELMVRLVVIVEQVLVVALVVPHQVVAQQGQPALAVVAVAVEPRKLTLVGLQVALAVLDL